MRVRFLALPAVLCVASVLLSGCGGKSEPDPNDPSLKKNIHSRPGMGGDPSSPAAGSAPAAPASATSGATSGKTD